MPNHFTVTIGQDPPYPCEYDVETNTLKAELPSSSPHEQSQVVAIDQDSGNMLHQQIWAHAMAYLNGQGVFEIPTPPAPAGASPISDDEMADINEDSGGATAGRHPVLSGPSPLNAPAVARSEQLLDKANEEIALLQAELNLLLDGPQTLPETVIAVQRVIINQMHSLYAVAVEDDEKMLAVMQRLLEDGEMVYNGWRGENVNS